MKRNILTQLFLLSFVSGYSHCAQAESSYFQQTLGVNIGYFFTDIDNSAKLSATESEIYFSTDIDLDNNVHTFKVDIFWRINAKHRLDFTWFSLFQDGERLTSKDLIINDTIIPSGTGLNSKYNYNRYQLNYTYNLFQGKNYELGPTLGVYAININTELNETITNKTARNYARADFIFPLPVVGLRGRYALTDEIIFNSSFNFMILSFDNWSGDIYDFQLGVEYNFLKYLGVGLAYNFSFLTIDKKGEQAKFQYNYDYQGVQTYLKFAF